MALSARWDLHLQLGRDFSPAYGTDTVGYILNEEAAKRIAYKDPVGKRLTFWGKKGTIIGVVRNFHFNSLHEPIKPLIIHYGEEDQWGNVAGADEGGTNQGSFSGVGDIMPATQSAVPLYV